MPSWGRSVGSRSRESRTPSDKSSGVFRRFRDKHRRCATLSLSVLDRSAAVTAGVELTRFERQTPRLQLQFRSRPTHSRDYWSPSAIELQVQSAHPANKGAALALR